MTLFRFPLRFFLSTILTTNQCHRVSFRRKKKEEGAKMDTKGKPLSPKEEKVCACHRVSCE
jgi:hypothetical protein